MIEMNTEYRIQETEYRIQNTEDRGQRTEDGRVCKILFLHTRNTVPGRAN